MIRINWISIVLRALLGLGASLAAAPAFADGDCLQWDVGGLWIISQSNGTTVRMTLEQNGTHIQGVGEYSSYDNDRHKVQTIGGPVDGYLEHGNFLRITAYWSNSTAGLYTGQIQPNGGMSGFAVDKNDPGNKADFRAKGYPHCLARQAPPPLPPASAPVAGKEPAVALGRVHIDSTSATEPVAGKKPVMALGRVKTDDSTTRPPICDVARSAKARNSPAAPGLERQCLAADGSMTPPPPTPPPPPPSTSAAPNLDDLAAVGAAIAEQDSEVAEARNTESSMFYKLGFDIASGLFGDPAMGAAGNTLMGPGSEKIRDSLSDAGQRGFDASVAFHQARDYNH